VKSLYYGKVTVEHPRPSMDLDPDEPCMIFRCQDELYADVAAYYISLCKQRGAKVAEQRGRDAYAEAIVWQHDNPDRLKPPD
jgi:hypothetical protein